MVKFSLYPSPPIRPVFTPCRVHCLQITEIGSILQFCIPLTYNHTHSFTHSSHTHSSHSLIDHTLNHSSHTHSLIHHTLTHSPHTHHTLITHSSHTHHTLIHSPLYSLDHTLIIYYLTQSLNTN